MTLKSLLILAAVIGMSRQAFADQIPPGKFSINPKISEDAPRSNPVFILLWVSSRPVVEDGRITEIELVDNQSIRASYFEIEQWMNAIKRRGKGFNFRIYEAYIWKEDLLIK